MTVTRTYTRTHVEVEFANPYLRCQRCGQWVRAWHNPDRCGCGETGWQNLPCGHQAGTESACPSWSPVDGCTCAPGAHDTPPAGYLSAALALSGAAIRDRLRRDTAQAVEATSQRLLAEAASRSARGTSAPTSGERSDPRQHATPARSDTAQAHTAGRVIGDLDGTAALIDQLEKELALARVLQAGAEYRAKAVVAAHLRRGDELRQLRAELEQARADVREGQQEHQATLQLKTAADDELAQVRAGAHRVADRLARQAAPWPMCDVLDQAAHDLREL